MAVNDKQDKLVHSKYRASEVREETVWENRRIFGHSEAIPSGNIFIKMKALLKIGQTLADPTSLTAWVKVKTLHRDEKPPPLLPPPPTHCR